MSYMVEITLHALHISVAPFTRRRHIELLIETKLEDVMILDVIILPCPIGDPIPYLRMAVFTSPDKAVLYHLKKLSSTSFYKIPCQPQMVWGEAVMISGSPGSPSINIWRNMHATQWFKV